MNTECIKQRRWMFVVFGLLVACISLSTYMAYRELWKYWKEHDILIVYGSLFLTPRQIDQLDRFKPVQVPVDTKPDKTVNGFCFANCSAPVYGYNGESSFLDENVRRQENASRVNGTDPSISRVRNRNDDQHEGLVSRTQVYHACCISRRRVMIPKRVENVYDQNVIVVQFKGRNQAFIADECRQARNCRGCQCAQTIMYAAAVVIDDDGRDMSDDEPQPNHGDFEGYRLELVRLPGYCKCMNNLNNVS